METSAALQVANKRLCSATRRRSCISVAATHVSVPPRRVRAFSFDSLTTQSLSLLCSRCAVPLHFSQLLSKPFFRHCSVLYSSIAAATTSSPCFLPSPSRNSMQLSLPTVSYVSICSSFTSSSRQNIRSPVTVRGQPAVLKSATHGATTHGATKICGAFTSACDAAATNTVCTLPVFPGRIPLILQPGNAAHVAVEDVTDAAIMRRAVAATAERTVTAAERKASVAAAAEAAGASLGEATTGARGQDLAASGGGGGFGTSSVAGLLAAAVTVASRTGRQKTSSLGVYADARFARAAAAESTATRTVKSTFAPEQIKADVVPTDASFAARNQHSAFTVNRAEKFTSRPTSVSSEEGVSALQESRNTQSVDEIGGTSQALRHLRECCRSISSLETPFRRAAIASYSIGVTARSCTASRAKLSIFSPSQIKRSFHASAHATAAANDKPAVASSAVLIPFAVETSLATAAINLTALFSSHGIPAAATATTAPRMPTTATSASSSLPTSLPAAAPSLSPSRECLFEHSARAFPRLSLTASGRTVAPTVPASPCCSFSFPPLQAPASPNCPSTAAATLFSGTSSLPSGDDSLSFPLAEFKIAAAELHESPVTAHNLSVGASAVRTVCLLNDTACSNPLHRAATCASTERDMAGSSTVEEHIIILYPSREDPSTAPSFSHAYTSGGNTMSGHTPAQRRDTCQHSERKRPKRLLLDPHVQHPLEQQLQQQIQRHSYRNVDRTEQIHHGAVQQLTQQHLMQKTRQDHVQRQEQRDIRNGLQQQRTITLDAMTLSAIRTARCWGSFAETDGFCPTRSSNAPLGRAPRIDMPHCVVPMLLRWRPKKSFKKKTMNLPSTKARRRWARLRR